MELFRALEQPQKFALKIEIFLVIESLPTSVNSILSPSKLQNTITTRITRDSLAFDLVFLKLSLTISIIIIPIKV